MTLCLLVINLFLTPFSEGNSVGVTRGARPEQRMSSGCSLAAPSLRALRPVPCRTRVFCAGFSPCPGRAFHCRLCGLAACASVHRKHRRAAPSHPLGALPRSGVADEWLLSHSLGASVATELTKVSNCECVSVRVSPARCGPCGRGGSAGTGAVRAPRPACSLCVYQSL